MEDNKSKPPGGSPGNGDVLRMMIISDNKASRLRAMLFSDGLSITGCIRDSYFLSSNTTFSTCGV